MSRFDDSFGKPPGYDDGVKAFGWTQTPDHDVLIAIRARGPNPDAVGVQQQAEFHRIIRGTYRRPCHRRELDQCCNDCRNGASRKRRSVEILTRALLGRADQAALDRHQRHEVS